MGMPRYWPRPKGETRLLPRTRTRSSNTLNATLRRPVDRGAHRAAPVTEPYKWSSRAAANERTRRTRPSLSRRTVIVGAVPVVAAAIGAVGALAVQVSQKVAAPGSEMAPVAAASPVESREAARAMRNVGVPEGMVLVASPRLPLAGVGPEDPWRLLTGRVVNWSEVGSAVPLPVHPLALSGEMAGGVQVERTLGSYEELVAAVWTDPAAVALVPAEMVDFRVQALAVGEDDPLDNPVGGESPVRIGVVGDIVPGRNVHQRMLEYGDFTRPFQRVAPLLRSFDVTVANLEGNLSETLPQPADPHSVSFVSSPAMLEGFTLAGIDAVTLANNHSVWNDEGWGVQGLLDT